MPEIGQTISHYRIIEKLGQGGMGVVYLAEDTNLNRQAAIKLLSEMFSSDPERMARLEREAKLLASLNHPNSATIYGLERADWGSFIALELVEGETLAQRVAKGPLPVDEALEVCRQIAVGIEAAHEKGVIHRDLKPANVMVTPKGHAKILDFGLAKLFPGAIEPGETAPTRSETIGAVGTPLYMSPEQAEGRPVDFRTDLWGIGITLYEALTGVPPFKGNSGLALLRAIISEDVRPVRELRADAPPEAESIVSKALEKVVTKRYQSAADMARDLSLAIARVSISGIGPRERVERITMRFAIPAALLVVALIVSGAWLYHRSELRHWAREEALPQIAALRSADKPLAAFLLWKQAEKYLSGDPQLAQIAAENTATISITSSPPGAMVEIQDYLSPGGDWYLVGTTPIDAAVIPNGYFRWRISKQGVGQYVAAPQSDKQMNFPLDAEVAAPEGVSWVEGRDWADFVGFVGMVGPYRLPGYYIDRFEVTNRQYQEFILHEGYSDRKYWPAKFFQNGHEITWEEAQLQLRDATGRPGPATWTGGHYPEGQADYPVSGVSWYEAAAYAAFAGKSLPTFAQWYAAAAPDVTRFIVQESNIARSKLAPVGSFPGLGVYGTYDMAGNVREWIKNDAGNHTNFLLGGAWRSAEYEYSDADARSPFDRSAENGIRCVRNAAPLPEQLTRTIPALRRDFTHYKPASDEVLRAYGALYSYDRTPLNPKSEGIVGETADWREEKVTFDAAYNGERMEAYLFQPKNVHPPYQAVLFSPSARVLELRDSRQLGDVQFFDYVVQSGRAVLYPVLQGTYERQKKVTFPGAAQELAYMTERYKDIARSLDYLETRTDINKHKFAYLGVSMGAAEGIVYATLAQGRLKAVVFLDGGYFLNPQPAGSDAADFAPRLKSPVLMVNGRDDYVFSVEKSQNPLFEMLGSPAAEKRHAILDTTHDVLERRPELIREVLTWLDKHLNRPN